MRREDVVVEVGGYSLVYILYCGQLSVVVWGDETGMGGTRLVSGEIKGVMSD